MTATDTADSRTYYAYVALATAVRELEAAVSRLEVSA